MQQHNQICKKTYFRKLTAKKGSKSFWNVIKPFSTNKVMIALLLKKMESLKTIQKKQQKFLITTI